MARSLGNPAIYSPGGHKSIPTITQIQALPIPRPLHKLLELTTEVADAERNVDEILSLVNDLAPQLLNGLALSNLRQIARTLEIRCFTNDTVVFLQNAPPDAYYTVLYGAVSIYFKHPTAESDMTMSEARRDYGKFLVQLKKPAGFGELSFQGDFNHTARNAGVVSDGDGTDYTTASVGHGTEFSSPVSTASPLASLGGTMNRKISPGVCVLLLIPEKTYMSEMYALHASKNQTKDKITLLKKNFLFMSWGIDQLVKLAYGMKKREYKKNENIVSQGDKSDHVFLIVKGKVKVSISEEVEIAAMENSGPLSRGNLGIGEKAGMTNKLVEIAELAENDIFGLVEFISQSAIMGRSITAASNVEVFCMTMSLFGTTMATAKATKEIIRKVVEKRKYWERLRLDYVTNFPSMKCSLPANAAEMSQYSLSMESAMNESELKDLKEKKTTLFQSLREARSSYRSAITKMKYKKFDEAIAELEKSKKSCDRAIDIASSVKDADIEQQARDINEEVVEQLSIQRSAMLGIDLALLQVEAPPTDGSRGRRGSAALVALRKRTLSYLPKDALDGPNPPTEKKQELPGGRARRATAASGCMIPNSRKSLEQSRQNRRTSIAELAAAAGLKQEFGDMDAVRKATTTGSPTGSPAERDRRLSRRGSAIAIKSAGGLLDSLLMSPAAKPTPPKANLTKRQSSRGNMKNLRRGSSVVSRKGSIAEEPVAPVEEDGEEKAGEGILTKLKKNTMGAIHTATSAPVLNSLNS